MAEKIVYWLILVFELLTIACLHVAVPSWKALRKRPITVPLLSDRRLHTLYVLLGLQAAVMIVQMILGLAADLAIGDILLIVFVVDPGALGFYCVQILCFLCIRLTLKAKKQMEENGGEPLPAMTHEEASKTPRIRSLRVLLIVFAAIGILIGVLAQVLKGSDAQETVVILAAVVVFLIAPLSALVHWLIFRRKK